MKRIMGLVVLFNLPLFSVETLFEIKRENFFSTDIPVPSFSVQKYNQQNIALSKIKINTVQPEMNNTVILMVERGDIDFMVNDLRKDGFNAKAYSDGNNYYSIAVDFTGKDEYFIADSSIGLAKYYYVKEVWVGRQIHNEIFSFKNKSNFKNSYATKIGTITGGMNNSPVDLTINKIEWTIKGGINLSPVDIKIDHDNKTIKGGANHSPVDLIFEWATEETVIKGGANLSPVSYRINWKEGILEGYSNHNPLKLYFDMKEGIAGDYIVEINGYANSSPVKLKYDKISGKIIGVMNHSKVDINLINCDLYDFLEYIFLFLN